MTGDTWQVTHNTWHVTHSVGWTFCQNFRFGIESGWKIFRLKDEWRNHLINGIWTPPDRMGFEPPPTEWPCSRHGQRIYNRNKKRMFTKLLLSLAGIEPVISWFVVRCLIHWATESTPPSRSQYSTPPLSEIKKFHVLSPFWSDFSQVCPCGRRACAERLQSADRSELRTVRRDTPVSCR